MKYYSKLNLYKNSTGTNYYNPDIELGVSYGWWQYIKRINGLLVFNNYTYSNTTNRHQRAGLSLIDYKYDLAFEAPRGLQDLDAAISHYVWKIERLKDDMAKPRTHKRKNMERLETIKQYEETIKQIKKLQQPQGE